MSLTLTFPTSGITWPNGSTCMVTPTYDSIGRIVSWTCQLTVPKAIGGHKQFTHEVSSMAEAMAIFTTLPK